MPYKTRSCTQFCFMRFLSRIKNIWFINYCALHHQVYFWSSKLLSRFQWELSLPLKTVHMWWLEELSNELFGPLFSKSYFSSVSGVRYLETHSYHYFAFGSALKKNLLLMVHEMWDLIPQLGIESSPCSLEPQSFNH